MKKALAVIAMVLLFASQQVNASKGDVVGKIYSTDICAYINGVEVQSYNIGGKTAVVIEDILNEASHSYVYNDEYRTLKFFSLKPDCLVEGKNESAKKPGTIVGRIYETDIKTSVYDVVLPTYNIGGKTAVAIEDLGCDGKFSPIGGRYEWNSEKRTISLEFLYENSNLVPNDKNVNLVADNSMTEIFATFEEVLHCLGGREHFVWPDYVTDSAEIEVVLPIKAQNETIGYYFRRPTNKKFTAFTYYYPEKIELAAKNYVPYAEKSRESVISHFLTYHSVGDAAARFDAEEYSFVYISVAMTSSTSYNLLQVYEDGRYIDYGKEISMRNRAPQDLVIDKENEKVTFKYVDRYTPEWSAEYEIDLKSGTIKEK